MGGVEQRFGHTSVRVGSFDGKLTGGLGLEMGRAHLSYGFTGRYDRDLPGEGASTAHAVQLILDF
jgi:hypothetical protein